MRYYRRHGIDALTGKPEMSQIHAVRDRPIYDEEWDDERFPAVTSSIRYSAGTKDNPHVFDTLFAHHSLRGAVPTVAALTLTEPKAHFSPSQRTVAPSSSLSRFSSPLVLQAQKMGLVVPSHHNTNASVTNSIGSEAFNNSISWDDKDRMEMQASEEMGDEGDYGWSTWQELHPSEISDARSMVRRVLATSPRSQRRTALAAPAPGLATPEPPRVPRERPPLVRAIPYSERP
jgi:hypothetical protein